MRTAGNLILVLLMLIVFPASTLLGQESEKSNPGGQSQESTTAETEPSKMFNAKLAKELGADDYGMKSYVMVTLITGPAKIEEPEKRAELFKGHFANMGRLAEEGKLVLSGPIIDGKPMRGIFILNVTTLEDAEKLVKTDPTVAAGVFEYELSKLYCTAALMKVNEIHKSIQKVSID